MDMCVPQFPSAMLVFVLAQHRKLRVEREAKLSCLV